MFAKIKLLYIGKLTVSNHLYQVLRQALPHTMGAIEKEITETDGDSDGYCYGLLLVLGSSRTWARTAPCRGQVNGCHNLGISLDSELLE